MRTLPASVSLLTMVANDLGHAGAAVTDEELSARFALWEGLRHRGLIDADTSEHRSMTALRCRRLPAFWWLASAEFATRVNAEYERCYPGTLATLGVPTEAGTDPRAWIDWLTKRPG